MNHALLMFAFHLPQMKEKEEIETSLPTLWILLDMAIRVWSPKIYEKYSVLPNAYAEKLKKLAPINTLETLNAAVEVVKENPELNHGFGAGFAFDEMKKLIKFSEKGNLPNNHFTILSAIENISCFTAHVSYLGKNAGEDTEKEIIEVRKFFKQLSSK